ncbi:hypothetical protein D3D03_04465 [Exiguobacterium sp. RIT452]|uniref:hypothetical protein n=1 Tax=unclassified Exiguobacterium TaxID=2644629 RepID=UPI000E74ADCD|nr:MULTISPECIES: hypothetical protein [unclassified Exiguobacterium]RJP02605.1 hypothetical protein D3D03_04465 [Exiguobacterium sp. RIT452]
MKKRLFLATGLYLLVMMMTIYAIFFEQSDSTFLLIIQLGLLIHFYFQYRMSFLVPDQDVPTAPFRLNVLRTGLIVAAVITYVTLDTVPLLLATAVALALALPTLVSYIRLRTQEN